MLPMIATGCERRTSITEAALNRFTMGLDQETRGKGIGVNALDVSAATPAYKYTLPNADFSQNEHSEGPAQLICWVASQPPEMTGHSLLTFL